MSSRAVRKTTGHTAQDDLAHVLQKVGISKHDSDDESDLVTTQANDHRRNVFEMLADDADNNDEKETVDSDHQVDENMQQESKTSKAKRKRKPKKKNVANQKSDQQDEDFFIIPEESRQESSADSAMSRDLLSQLLTVDSRFLNPLNEMKKKFGTTIVEQIERENLANQLSASAMPTQRRRTHMTVQQRPTTRLAKQNAFITSKLGWPTYFKHGLSMKPSSPISETSSTSGNYFQYEYDKDYQRLQIQFFDSVDRHDLQGIMDILRQYPYHIDSLIHLSDVSRMQDDTPTAVDLIERALYSFQQAFHPLFSITRGECRLEYRIQANRSLFICLFKNIIYIGERGCSRTALEFCKVLLSLNPVDDPLAILLLLDYYAIRSEEYNYLIRFHTEQNERIRLDGLPNFAYSLALAHFRLSAFDKASEILQNALLRFPSVLKYLLDKMSIRPDQAVERCQFFSNSERHETDALRCVQQLYAVRMSNEWKEKNELEFLRTNVHQVIQIIEQNRDPRIENYGTLRGTGYRKTPINVCRHIILSESNEIRGFLTHNIDNDGRFYNVDPFPPADSIASFQRPERPILHINSSYNGMGMLLRSLLPNFNLENFLVAPDAQAGAAAAAGGAQGAEDDAGMLQALQESIRDFIRDIGRINIGDGQLQEPRVDDDDDDGDDNEENDHEFD